MKTTKRESRKASPKAKVSSRKKTKASSRVESKQPKIPASRISGASSAALYLYGITGGGGAVRAERCPGVDGAGHVRAIETHDFDCWVSDVDRRPFVEEIERHMEDLEWLAAASVNHQKTVERLAAQTTIVPARFGAVFTSEQSLRESIAGRAARLTETLRRLHGAEEWGVKIFFAPEAPKAVASAASGREYLTQKAQAMNVARAKSLPAGELERLTEALQRSSVDWVPGKANQPNLIWSASFLIRRGAQRDQFDAVMRDFATRWQGTHQIEYTGPWPPYSFV